VGPAGRVALSGALGLLWSRGSPALELGWLSLGKGPSPWLPELRPWAPLVTRGTQRRGPCLAWAVGPVRGSGGGGEGPERDDRWPFLAPIMARMWRLLRPQGAAAPAASGRAALPSLSWGLGDASGPSVSVCPAYCRAATLPRANCPYARLLRPSFSITPPASAEEPHRELGGAEAQGRAASELLFLVSPRASTPPVPYQSSSSRMTSPLEGP